MCWHCFEHTMNHANEIECGRRTVYHTSIIRIDRIEKVIRLKSFISRNFNTRLLVLSTQNHIGNCYCNMQSQLYAKFGTGVDAFFPFFYKFNEWNASAYPYTLDTKMLKLDIPSKQERLRYAIIFKSIKKHVIKISMCVLHCIPCGRNFFYLM